MVGSSKHYGPEPVVLLFIFHIVFVFEAAQTECLTVIIRETELFLCLSWKHMWIGGIAPQIFNLSFRWRWMVSFMLCCFLSRERASVDMLDIRLSVYCVNEQTKFDMACHFFTDSFLVQRQCLLDSKSSIIFHLLHICPFVTFTITPIVKLKVHKVFVLSTSCVPERVGINQTGKSKKWYSHKKIKRTKLLNLWFERA